MRVYIKYIVFFITLISTILCFKHLFNFINTFKYYSWKTNEDLISHMGCFDKIPVKYVSQHGDYFVINNFVRGSKTFKCNESITYTTQADYTYLDNVPILVSRWMGPISISLYAPGDDFIKTMESIAYLRICDNEYISQFVTFHVYFPSKHFPTIKFSSGLMEAYKDTYDCLKGPPFKNQSRDDLYRIKNKLLYPINIGRNIARQLTVTHFVLCSDIELYPSPNFIVKFLKMINGLKEKDNKVPAVYPIPVFELVEGAVLPENKTILQKLTKTQEAFWFHEKICSPCHMLPKAEEWLAANESDRFEIFTVTKRKGKYDSLEAFYVGTKSDPLFLESLSWEGKINKMQQAYIQCLLNYDYKILSNAFLVHKPGIKKSSKSDDSLVYQTNKMLKDVVKPQMNRLYGEDDG